MATADAFWEEESTPVVRRLFLDEAAGRDTDRVTFEFNAFAVTLDFDDRTATVQSVLEEGVSEVVKLDAFLDRAASFGDDPSAGDGLTEVQRRPAGFRITPTGVTSPIERDGK